MSHPDSCSCADCDGGPSMEDAPFTALDLLPKVREKLFSHRDVFGSRRGVRVDIPSSNRGQEVLTIHEGPRGGTVLGYDHSVYIYHAEFYIQPRAAAQIGASGKAKFAMAFIGGVIQPAGAPQGEQIIYNPRREHLFTDMAHRPVRGAYEVWQIGKITYAKGIIYYAAGEAPTPPEGMDSAVTMPGSRQVA